MSFHLHPVQKAFFNGTYLGDVMTPTEPEKPKVLIVGLSDNGKELYCTYNNELVILNEKDREEQKFKDVEEIKLYVEKLVFTRSAIDQIRKHELGIREAKTLTSMISHTPKVKKDVGGDHTTLKARKKLLAKKLRNR